MPNATFYSFKSSGKWGYSSRGELSEGVFRIFPKEKRREQILKDNNGLFPGMSTTAEEYIWVIIPDEDHPNGFPLLLNPEQGH